MKTYLVVYIGSLLLAALITPVLIRISRAVGICDNPDARKVHTSAIPHIGGTAIFLSMIVMVIPTLFLDNHIGESFRKTQIQVITLLATGSFIFFVGLIDDLHKLRARYKLLAQVFAAVILYLAGVRIDVLNVANLFTLHLGLFSFPITILWFTAITNAVNLIDGLDGLAAGIATIACAVIAILAFHSCQPLMIVFMLALLGGLSGFLFFNFNPARIFMGDCGSMFLGFTIASASVMCGMKSKTIVALALPALALGLPIFDTIFSILRRYLQRRGIMSPDRSHMHHRLLDMGLHHRHAVIIMYAMTILTAGLGTFMIYTRNVQTIMIFVCILLLLILAFSIIGSVNLRETIKGLQKRHAITNQMKQERESFESVQLQFCRARTFDQWWQSVCLAARHMNFATISMSVTNRDGTKRILTLGREGEQSEPQNIVKMVVPIRDRRVGPHLELKAKVHSDGSLESAGRRITLFARLMEEYGIAHLKNETKNTSAFKLATA
jgi:UDP-GlcNAc:undecaprenyl-phosphate GlcNAc-1-phosphate transferase